jgi:amidase
MHIRRLTRYGSQLNKRRNDLQIAYAAKWNVAGIDGIICPANASVASAHGESKYWWGCTSVFNILDYNAAVFLVSVGEETDTWEAFPCISEDDLTAEDSFF